MKIAFLSSMYGSTWGGSEELWGGSALRLCAQGHDVFAGWISWPGPAAKRDGLRAAGCRISERVDVPAVRDRLLNRLRPTSQRILKQDPVPADLLAFQPDVAVISQMFTDDGLEWMEFCHQHDIPYVTVVQAGTEYQWPADDIMLRLRKGYQNARKAYFVSEHNQRLCESQIAVDLPNGEVVWNPFTPGPDEPLPWPELENGIYKFACVGRLQPDAKGQDVIIDVMSMKKWKERPISLTFFGSGCNRNWTEAYCRLRGVDAVFPGFSKIDEIWKSHHVLIHPTRKEGMPIVILEAALFGRPVVATSTAGIPELVTDGENGFLAPFATAELFDDALERAWQRRDELATIGRNAFTHARKIIPADPCADFAVKLLEVASAPRG